MAMETRAALLGPRVKVGGTSEKSTQDPVGVVRSGVIVRGALSSGSTGLAVSPRYRPGRRRQVGLLRSWAHEAALAEHAALMPVQDDDRDAQRFWTSVADALRATVAGT
jgi:hypothetical protein